MPVIDVGTDIETSSEDMVMRGHAAGVKWRNQDVSMLDERSVE